MGTSSSFQFRNEQFFARSRKSRDCAEVYRLYTAQTIPQIDAEIAEKCHFWMETRWEHGIPSYPPEVPFLDPHRSDFPLRGRPSN